MIETRKYPMCTVGREIGVNKLLFAVLECNTSTSILVVLILVADRQTVPSFLQIDLRQNKKIIRILDAYLMTVDQGKSCQLAREVNLELCKVNMIESKGHLC